MKRRLSLRELLLLGVLLIAAVYTFALHRPLSGQMALIEEQRTMNEGLLLEAETKCVELRRMEKALAESGAVAEIPRYNNLSGLLTELHAILDGADSYSLELGGEESALPLVTREVSVRCTVESYEEVMEIVRALRERVGGCVITDFAWSDKLAESAGRYGAEYALRGAEQPQAGRYSVSMELRCYEYAG